LISETTKAIPRPAAITTPEDASCPRAAPIGPNCTAVK
jgi:hypothetical protein